ncbi:MAG: M23 family metallopeptidase [Dehalococcoidia bacterium]
MRTVLAAATLVAALALLGACTGSSATVSQTTASSAPLPTLAPIVSPAPAVTATSAPGQAPSVIQPTPVVAAVSGLDYPLAGACLPAIDNLMPNAPRLYRAGIHEGVDFYPGLACAEIVEGTSVLAAEAGAVVRADWGFQEMTVAELDELLTRSKSQGYTDSAAMDRFRGRQVWIDHGGGIITRYAHLSGIAPGIEVGMTVQAGQLLSYVGDSGTPEAVTAPGAETHLHFEIRVGESYLGEGLAADEVRALLAQAFSNP